MNNSLKTAIINQVKIIDLAAEFEILLESTSGKFDYRCKCPAQNHKSGSERTSSLYIDSINNNYYCFGCHSSYNSIDFYMICSGFSFSEAMTELKSRVTETLKDYTPEVKADNFLIMLEISELFRNTIFSHHKDLKWINALMKKTDQYMSGLKKEDVDKANELLLILKDKITERYK